MNLEKNRYIKNDWFKKPIPKNVYFADGSAIDSSYGFLHYESKKKAGVKIGKHTTINSSLFQIGKNGQLIIGDYGNFVQPIFNTNKKITIGNYALVAYGVIIADSGYLIPPTKNSVMVKSANKGIKIGNNVWIGIKAMIFEGADIGDNSIIGAGAVVNFKVPKNSIVVGNPARIIKQKIK